MYSPYVRFGKKCKNINNDICVHSYKIRKLLRMLICEYKIFVLCNIIS